MPSATRKSVAMDNCPGLGIGAPLNKEEYIVDLQRFLAGTRKDFEAYEKYIHEKRKVKDIDKEIKEFEESWRQHYFLRKKGKLESVFAKGKKIIEPFAELGLIPPHPLVVLWNEKVEEAPQLEKSTNTVGTFRQIQNHQSGYTLFHIKFSNYSLDRHVDC